MRRTVRTATPEQIARNGHVAALIRKRLTDLKWKPKDLNAALKLSSGHPTVYSWLSAEMAPGPEYREKLAKIFKTPPENFMPRPLNKTERTEIVVHSATVLAPAPKNVLTLAINNQGEARIQLDVSLPAQQAMALARSLFDFGITIEPK